MRELTMQECEAVSGGLAWVAIPIILALAGCSDNNLPKGGGADKAADAIKDRQKELEKI
jgi:hypothetical protein